MKEEIVLKIVDNLSHGNDNMQTVLGLVYRVGKPVIEKWPDDAVGLFSRRIIRATSRLIHEKITFERLVLRGDKYWEGEEGLSVNVALANFIETRRKKK